MTMHRRVALHLDVERVVHRLDEEELSHRRILRSSARSCACDAGGSAYACSKTSDGSGGRLGLRRGDPGAHELERLVL